MKAVRYVIVILYVLSLAACGGGSGGGGSNSPSLPEPPQSVTDENGVASIVTESGDTLEVSLADSSGNAVKDMTVSFSETNGFAVLVVSDSAGKYGTTIMIGTADELAGKFARSARASYGMNVVLGEKNSQPVGFNSGAENLGYLYISDSMKEALECESGLYTVSELVNYFRENYSESMTGSSFLHFKGEVTDSTAASVLYDTELQRNEDQSMYSALSTRIRYLYGEGADTDTEKYYVECYCPDGLINYDSICEITRLSEMIRSDIYIGGVPQTSVTADTQYSFYPAAYDEENDELTFSIENKPEWALFDETTGALTGMPAEDEAGTYARVIISVSDGEHTAYTEPFTITVYEYNSPPIIGGTPYKSVTGDSAYSFHPYAYDADGDPLTFSIENKPSWAAFDESTGSLTGKPTDAQAGIYRNVRISVSDGQETSSIDFFDIRVNEYNSAPVIMGTPYTSVTGDSAYSFYPSAYDADGDSLTYSIENKPTWASFSTSTGALTGTPTEAQADVYENVTISVSDGEVTSKLDPFDITVNKYNSAPVIMGTPYTSVTGDSAYSFYPSAYDVDNDSLTYSIENKPVWASFSTSTGALTGTPTEDQAGVYENVTISVSDGEVTSKLDPFDITVNEYNSAPVIIGAPYTSATANSAYSFYPVAYDVDGDKLTFSIINKPDWAAFDEDTGALTGTPGQAGNYAGITISVTDGKESVSLTPFDITVNYDNSAPQIFGYPGTSVKTDEEYSFRPSAYDADGDSLIYSIENKPSWASFSTSTGQLSGTPSSSHIGQYQNIIISVSDTHSHKTSLPAFSISVQGDAPLIFGYPDTSVYTGEEYSFRPSAYDANSDTLTYSIENKPEWAAFDTSTGELTGTPEGIRVYERPSTYSDLGDVKTYSNIRISVSDGHTTTSLSSFSIEVKPVQFWDDESSGTLGLFTAMANCHNWSDAGSDGGGLGHCKNWRIPTLEELKSVSGYNFTNYVDDYYWTIVDKYYEYKGSDSSDVLKYGSKTDIQNVSNTSLQYYRCICETK